MKKIKNKTFGNNVLFKVFRSDRRNKIFPNALNTALLSIRKPLSPGTHLKNCFTFGIAEAVEKNDYMIFISLTR